MLCLSNHAHVCGTCIREELSCVGYEERLVSVRRAKEVIFKPSNSNPRLAVKRGETSSCAFIFFGVKDNQRIDFRRSLIEAWLR